MAAAPSQKKNVEPESMVTSETVIQSRDKEHDWTDLRKQSHIKESLVRNRVSEVEQSPERPKYPPICVECPLNALLWLRVDRLSL